MSKGINKVILVQLYTDGLSIPQVAEHTGHSISTIRYHLKNAGVLRSRVQAILLASKQGRLGSGLRGKKRNFTNDHKNNISKARQHWAKHNAKGVSLKPNGYLEITTGTNKGQLVHRVIAEQLLGRPLYNNEVVHHIDKNRANNDPSNLQVMTFKEHCRHHAMENHSQRKRNNLGRFI